MDWNLFWSAFGAIGTTVGSLITGVAVVVAVKQYKQPLEKKIVVSYGTTLPIMTDNSMGSYHMFIDAKNLGVRDGDADKILDQLRVRRFICILTKTASVL